jgi:L-malate glycosyltransferase
VNGLTGFLGNVGDIKGMSEHAIQLLSNEKMLAEFKANASEHASHFDIHNIVPRYEALYNRFLVFSE